MIQAAFSCLVGATRCTVISCPDFTLSANIGLLLIAGTVTVTTIGLLASDYRLLTYLQLEVEAVVLCPVPGCPAPRPARPAGSAQVADAAGAAQAGAQARLCAEQHEKDVRSIAVND